MPFKYESLKARLEANSKTVAGPLATPCKVWTGKISNSGYGVLTRRDDTGQVKSLNVHKVAFLEVAKKKLKRGHEVSHRCHNRKCWNPVHLIGETHEANCARREA